MENKRKHLDYIQSVVNRMAANSFLLKGWSVTLVAGLLALSVATGQKIALIAISFAPALVFWILDGYFLWQERLYRNLYDTVRVKGEDEIDFDMNPHPAAKPGNTWLAAMGSKTLLIFYLALIGVMIAVIAFLALGTAPPVK
jgi:hypothetical protein